LSLLLDQRLAFDCKNSPWRIYNRFSDLYWDVWRDEVLVVVEVVLLQVSLASSRVLTPEIDFHTTTTMSIALPTTSR